MYVVRSWATRNSNFLNRIYRLFASAFHALDPVWCAIGVRRLEKPFAFLESAAKGFLFDCTMCGRCVLSVTGMTCPTNCPKSVRNGPCGGVRANGHCEVKPNMPCVWVEAWAGTKNMGNFEAFNRLLPPRDHTAAGASAWLHLAAENEAIRKAAKENKSATTP